MILRRALFLAFALAAPIALAQSPATSNTAPAAQGQPAARPTAAAPAKPTPFAPASTSIALAQSPTFEVASVRQAKTMGRGGVRFTPDGVVTEGIPLKSILRAAYYEYRDPFWIGEPSWLNSTYYDIQAKFDPAVYKDATDDQRRVMLQALLGDRFKLVVHRETREISEYALVVAKGGPKLRAADASKYLVDEHSQPFCRAGLTNFRQCTMEEFAHDAAILAIDRPVVDHTGLTGRYDFELIYTRSGSQPSAALDAPPDILDALPEQIGLKLEPIKGTVEVLVIDHIEKPAEN